VGFFCGVDRWEQNVDSTLLMRATAAQYTRLTLVALSRPHDSEVVDQMYIGRIDIPGEVLDAQSDGKLVIFAGAGVSMSPPSNLPDFRGLADSLGSSVLRRETEEPIEQYLGRLHDRRVKVHELTVQRLARPDSRPNSLHESLVRIASSAGVMHIVTTNFDSHFSAVARDLVHSDFETFVAPALPLGDRFSGLVHLHGSVCADCSRMVLTDRDFSRAYITEGWARRFLLGLFREHTVLFVGYSHSDSIMSYLARGLTLRDGGQRYALVPELERGEGRWEFLGITPIRYGQNDPDDHGALCEGLEKWAALSSFGAMDHEKRVATIVGGVPPLSPEDDDYLTAVLRDPARLRFFVRHARAVEWLRWAEDKKALMPVVDHRANLDECQRLLASWVADAFACERTEDCLGLIQRNGQQMNPLLWHEVFFRLAYRRPAPSASVLSKWVPLLVQEARTADQDRHLCRLMERCGESGCNAAVLLLLDHVIQARSVMRQALPIAASGPSERRQVRWAATVPLGWHDLDEVWQSVFAPRLDVMAQSLLLASVTALERMHEINVAVGQADSDYDPVSYVRHAVEKHEQDRHRGDADPPVDVARNVLEWLARNEPSKAESLAGVLVGSQAPLVRRLSVHCVRCLPCRTGDWKARWVLEHSLLFARSEKHEAYQLLRDAYPCAGEAVRRRVLRAAAAGPDQGCSTASENRQHAIYNLMCWLAESAPDCRLTAEALDQMVRKHPDFRPREHPGLDHYSVRGAELVRAERAVTSSSLTDLDPASELDRIISATVDQPAGLRQSTLSTLSETVCQNWAWGKRLMESAERNGFWSPALWDSILRGMARCEHDRRHWQYLVPFVERNVCNLDSPKEVSRVLCAAAMCAELPLAQLDRAERAFTLLWEHARVVTAAPALAEHAGWYFAIEDHVGGSAAGFWVHAIWHRVKRDRKTKAVPGRYRRILGAILSDSSAASAAATAMLAHYVQFFYAVDPLWTQRCLLPLLDWDSDAERAECAWQCYLNNTRVDILALHEAMAYYRQTFRLVGSKLGSFREVFADHIGLLAVESTVNPLDSDWLGEFIRTVEPEDRQHWAWAVGQRLESLNPAAVQAVWSRWMEAYWSQRIAGVPLLLEEGELAEMVGWLSRLQPVFSEAVGRVCAGPEIGDIPYHELVKLDWLVNFPEPLADLLLFALKNASKPFYSCEDAVKLVELAHAAGATKRKVKDLCDHLVLLSCRRADELGHLLE